MNSSAEAGKETGKTDRPNILIILVDDMGYSDIGCYGSEIMTPRIDTMADEGVMFTQMYNCARCCPTRASLLTGLQPHQAGVGHMVRDLGHPSYQGYLNDNCVTIAEVLKSAGYRTILSGKWHVGGGYDIKNPETWKPGDPKHPTPTGRGFDEFYGILEGCGNYFNPHTLMRNDRFVEAKGDDFYFTDRISDFAAEQIVESAGKAEPFFLYAAYTAPHWPLHALPEDIAKFEGRYRKGWDRLRKDRYDSMVEKKVIDDKWKLSPRDEDSMPWEDVELTDWEDRRMAVYAAQVNRMDQGVGRILDALKRSGADENTIVMFLSDNGGCAEFLAEDGFVQSIIYPNRDGSIVKAGNFPGLMPGGEETYMSYDLPWANASNTPFRLFKHWVHEGGIATPFIVRWPEKLKGKAVNHSPAHVADIMAACVEAAGAAYPEEENGYAIHPMAGESFLPALTEGSWTRQKPVFWEHEGNCAMREGPWKLVRRHPGDWELYNMEQDRTEQIDLRGEDPERALRMIGEWKAWARRCDVLPWEEIWDGPQIGKKNPRGEDE
jgi:arylsulfatase